MYLFLAADIDCNPKSIYSAIRVWELVDII